MSGFLSHFSSFSSIFWVVFFFGGSIFVHELGHFIAAKKRKLFVPRFSIGFGPRLYSKTIGGTEFCCSLFLLGGYVAIPQLMNIKELEGKYHIPENLPSVSCWDRIVVSAMGAIFNILFAFTLACILWVTGLEQPQYMCNNIVGYVYAEMTLPGGEKVPNPARISGLQIGDRILKIDGIQTRNSNDIIQGIALGTNRDSQGPVSTITIMRDGHCQDVIVHPLLVEQNRRSKESYRDMGIETFQELFIGKIYQHSPAECAGLKNGDKLLSVNGEKIFSDFQFNDILKHTRECLLTIERDAKPITVSICPINLPQRLPYLKIATPYGNFEVSPTFDQKNAIVDLHQDPCVLRLLSMDSKLQEQWPQWSIGDSITQIQHQSIGNFADGISILQSAPNTPITLTIGGQEYPILVQKTELSASKSYPSIGIGWVETRVLVHENPFRQIQQGIQSTILTLGSFMAPTSDVHLKNMMGPSGILDAFHTFAQYDLRLLLWLVIIININLAIFNLLPIPILDGGIIALTLFEAIFRRKIATKLLAGIQSTFMVLFLGLILYVSFFDINRILERQDQKKQYHRQLQLEIDKQLLWNGLSTSHLN